MATLSPLEVQEYIRDKIENNHLLDGQEFTPTLINLAMELAIDEWNMMTPPSSNNATNFPFKSLLMSGTLWKLFQGQAALLARNTMSYSDGGIQIPIEERSQLYLALAEMFGTSFRESSQRLKININIESGWGEVLGDSSAFPDW